MTQFFSSTLLLWHRQNPIDHAWKKDVLPYNIWVSEIILQQTRVAQGTPYYIKFIKNYPTVLALSKTTEKKLFSIWEGLGYYRRASNMLKGAKYIVETYNGKFPKTYKEIIEIPGVGPYTAAAISSFAYNLPHAVVDGNVNRVISRWHDIDEDLTKQKGKKQIQTIAQRLLEESKEPSLFNQAIMDFGANQCKPVPICEDCMFNKKCKAFLLNKVGVLPRKKQKKAKKKRYFHSFLFTNHLGNIAIQKRTAKDIWQGLYQLPMIETKSIQSIESIEIKNHFSLGIEPNILKTQKFSQILSHQIIQFVFYNIPLTKEHEIKNKSWTFTSKSKIKNYGFPKTLTSYISNNYILDECH